MLFWILFCVWVMFWVLLSKVKLILFLCFSAVFSSPLVSTLAYLVWSFLHVVCVVVYSNVFWAYLITEILDLNFVTFGLNDIKYFNFCLLHPVLRSSQINVYAIQMFVTIYLTNLKPKYRSSMWRSKHTAWLRILFNYV